ncbi:DNA-binding protein RHL1 isoform X1 [Tripterygium wilfordii]|uniref:DNA-binding protein RHL1 isoform X1 n=1 Tax=Tripterygium wilfordii TaxID=458696 RepID=UPI0018F85C0D|nr:DNA-binding protein RHL1 isoform X1 [Tripterygium wilfordii]
MVKRGSSSSAKRPEEANPEVLERKRLKKLAFANNILSEAPVSADCPLAPSKTVIKHHGKDILKKSQRKNRFLFSFPGLLAPIDGGKIGDLKDLGTKNPVLYLDFPQGQMKLFGTIVYPKNRYLTLQFSRGGKNVVCEDYFDNMIVFSDAWWIGRKDENPEEARLDFPKELTEGQHVECDFKGGAGVASVDKQVVHKIGRKNPEELSPEVEIQDDMSEGGHSLKKSMEVTPIRHSARNSGKILKFVDISSGDDSIGSGTDVSEEEKKLGTEFKSSVRNKKTGNLYPAVIDIDYSNASEGDDNSKPQVNLSEAKSEQLSLPSVALNTFEEDKRTSHGSLVQATISTLFKKVDEKKVSRNPKKSPSSKVSGQKPLHSDLKRKIDKDEGPRKKGKINEENTSPNLASGFVEFVGTGNKRKKKAEEVDDDEIEEFSSSSQDTIGSDEDWVA